MLRLDTMGQVKEGSISVATGKLNNQSIFGHLVVGMSRGFQCSGDVPHEMCHIRQPPCCGSGQTESQKDVQAIKAALKQLLHELELLLSAVNSEWLCSNN